MNKLNYSDLLTLLNKQIDKHSTSRYFIALSGAPGSGKSTVSEKLVSDLNTVGHKSRILQMDAFHYDDQILKGKNLLLKKGAPETFDVMGLLNFINRLEKESEVVIPVFDRSLELSRSSAVIVSDDIKVVIIEGNYLLLKSHPWRELHKFFNSTIMVNCDEKILEERLIKRWENFNLSKDVIKQKVYENDLPNGIDVLKNSISPDFELSN